jgi:hypothetical protein
MKKLLPLLSLFAAWAAFGQSTNPPVMRTPVVRTDDYRTTYLSWPAQTGTVYQVESADILGTQSMQGLKWVIRDSDTAARGTNAEWVDFGDARWIPRVFHPIFQPFRFYRVVKVKQATLTPPTVTVQVLQGGSPLPGGTNSVGGYIYVATHVTPANTNDQLSSVGVFVDGQKLYSISRYDATNFVNTTQWPNGLHEIYAVANTIDYSETLPDSDAAASTNAAHLGIGHSVPKFLVFSNFISQYFIATPFFDAGQTQQVLAAFDADANWRVRVVNNQNTTVRTYTGTGTKAFAAWDGKNQNGSALSYGYYDYYVEARPSQYGPLGAAGGSGFTSGGSSSDPEPSFALPGGTNQLNWTNSNVTEDLLIPSLNPADVSSEGGGSGGLPSPFGASMMTQSAQAEKLYPTTLSEALFSGWPMFYTQPAPMPPVRIKGQWYPYDEVYGPSPLIEMAVPQSIQDGFAQSQNFAMSASSFANGAAAANWPDANYVTHAPMRAAGSIFYGNAGTVGIGAQGHHPSPEPYFANPAGGVISLSRPPYGRLVQATTIADNFANDMGSAGWRTSFLLKNDNFGSIDIASQLGAGSGTSRFARNCNFGFIVGHMTASRNVDPNYGYSSVSYLPLYNSTANVQRYDWIGLPGMDLGAANGSVFSKLRWMSLYGCNSLRQADFNDMWSKFVLPMPPNLRLLLGSEDGVFIHPLFGGRYADNLNGFTTPNGAPMAIPAAWYDAAQAADIETAKQLRYRILGLGTRRMTVVFRDITQEGSWSTYNDSIWGWYSDISYDWFDVTLEVVPVYPP